MSQNIKSLRKTCARFVGTETHGFDIYGDAVWLEFKNGQCSVLYHAQRQTLPSQQ